MGIYDDLNKPVGGKQLFPQGRYYQYQKREQNRKTGAFVAIGIFRQEYVEVGGPSEKAAFTNFYWAYEVCPRMILPGSVVLSGTKAAAIWKELLPSGGIR